MSWYIKNCIAKKCGAANLGAAGALGAVGGANAENGDDLAYRRTVQGKCDQLRALCGGVKPKTAAARQKLALAVSKSNACGQALRRKGKAAAMEAQKRYDEGYAAYKEAGTAGLDVPVKASNFNEITRAKARQIRAVVNGVYDKAQKCAVAGPVPSQLTRQLSKAEGVYDDANRLANNAQPCGASDWCMRDRIQRLDGYYAAVSRIAQDASRIECN
jgi:hypothetical protein